MHRQSAVGTGDVLAVLGPVIWEVSLRHLLEAGDAAAVLRIPALRASSGHGRLQSRLEAEAPSGRMWPGGGRTRLDDLKHFIHRLSLLYHLRSSSAPFRCRSQA